MRSITTALLLLATARSIPTEKYEIPAGKTIKEVKTFEPSEESATTHSERVGRLPACETELVFPCDVQKIYLEKFVDDSEGQLTLEDLEQMSKAIQEIYADQKEQDEIFNALDLLVDQKSDEVLAFGLNVLNGDVELADESLMYAVNGEAIWDKEVMPEDATEEPVVTEEIIIVTEDAEGLEMTDAPVEHEQKQSYLAPKAETQAPKGTKVTPSFTMHPTYTQRSYTTYPVYTQGSYTTHPTYAQEPIPTRSYKPYVSEVAATYAPRRATYAPRHATYPLHATYAPHATYTAMPPMYTQTPEKTFGASRKVAQTMTAKPAKPSTYTLPSAASKKQHKGSKKARQSTNIGARAYRQTNYATGAPLRYTHKTRSPVAAIPVATPKTAALPAYPRYHPTAPLPDTTVYAPRYTVAPIEYTHQTYPYHATNLPHPVEPVYPRYPLEHTIYRKSEEPITGTGN